MNPLEKKHWIGIRREPEGKEDRNKCGKGQFWRKQENAAKHGARLRGWRAKIEMKMLHKRPIFLME
jgi:hypothetical protein